MLDTATKRRIDDCRDILVGKLPDPKAQIEQITIGLIYKFMNDMDNEAIELGGQAKFFADYKVPDPEYPNDRQKDKTIEFRKYAWDSLLSPKVTAAEMLTLYSEAIVGMDKNPNIPQLFRDIFKNAYLPYRDPETLKMFLKTIAEFEYTHSEMLGDAFEYLLSVMGSQGDAGQFRTPRHIIDFLVAIVDPGKNDTILDPACGTAGFLISSFKHIKEKNNELTPDERRKLIQNFVGYDISPDMVRLSLVNLYLHGFSDPHIHEYDTLSSEERWADGFDVILANPPFMSPKGGIRPHKKFSISSNRSEVLFVDYIAEHLNPKGKAGIIVPEGVIFQSGVAYKDLRKMLVENFLYAVVSLPAGVFNPYSGVKTSILLLDKGVARNRNEILFLKIDNDGYNLGSQRAPVKGSQLNEAINLVHEFVKSGTLEESPIAHIVPKIAISIDTEYTLNGDSYKKIDSHNHEFKNVPIKSIFIRVNDTVHPNDIDLTEINYLGLENIESDTGRLVGNIVQNPKEIKSLKNRFQAGDILYGKLRPNLNKVLYAEISGICSTDILVLRASIQANAIFYSYLFRSKQFNKAVLNGIKGAQLPRIGFEYFSQLNVPHPSLYFQEKFAAEILSYQKIIDGAQTVMGNYKSQIVYDAGWEMIELDSVAKVINGFAFSSNDFKEDNSVPCIKITNVGVREFIDHEISRLPAAYLTTYSKHVANTGDLVISLTRTIISSGLKITRIPQSWNNTLVNQRVALLKSTSKANIDFIYHYLCSDTVYKYVEEKSRSLMQPNLSIVDLKKLEIPNPTIEVQNSIVAQIEYEQKLVDSNKEIIVIFNQKINDRIAKVWGE